MDEKQIDLITKKPTIFAKKATNDELIQVLRVLSDHYYNTGEALVSDEIFDILKNILQDRDPTNPFLKEIGARASSDKVQLPYHMASLDKIKPDTGLLEKWMKKHKGPYVVSDKLDGVSGLLVVKNKKSKLYTRGDGYFGQDISHLIKFVIPKTSLESLYQFKEIAIRGELIMSKANFEKISGEFKNARNAVAGLTNSKHISTNVAKLTEFVAYTIINPKHTQQKQMEMLEEINFPLVPYSIEKDIDNDFLSKLLIKHRKESKYEIDGIVVIDSSKVYELTEGNPTYGFAFKAVLTDQVAEATVLKVNWEISKYGYLKPTLEIEPINLRGVEIKNVTAHNAKYVVDNKIGPGTVIKLIRSGDVIPKIEDVIKSTEAELPDIPYKWNKTEVDFIVKDIHTNASDSIKIKVLTNFFSHMGVKHISEGIITKLVENDYDDIFKILDADKTELINIDGIGKIMVNKMFTNLNASFQQCTLPQLMASTTLFGRGLGERKLKIITKAYPNIMKEKITKDKIMELEGFDDITASQFMENFDKFAKFYSKLTKYVDLKHLSEKKDVTTDSLFKDKKIVFTGFRSSELEKFVENNGGSITSSVSKNTYLVVYTDTESSKYKKAVDLKIPIMTLSEFKNKYGQ